MDKRAANGHLPFHLVYHDGYELSLGPHVFPAEKYRLARERLLAGGHALEADFSRPEAASDDDVALVHHPEWIRRLRTGTLTLDDVRLLEIPYSRQVIDAYFLAAGGTTLAARLALREGIGFNLGGGFHHAFERHGEGFCAINDIAVAIRCLQRDGLLRTAMVVDCDVHHGNGTASIFQADPTVFTFSIHQFNNYPARKPHSTVDIHLPDGIGDEEYLQRLADPLRAAVAGFQPELAVYVAGADPYYEDQLGGLRMTLDGLRERDRLVIAAALSRRIPVAIVLAGGYALNLEDTVTIHTNTVLAAKKCLEESGWLARPGN